MKILLIGAGKMGKALLVRWISNNTHLKKNITVAEINAKRRNILKKKYPELEICARLPLKWKGDLVVLAIKPQIFTDIGKEINSKNIKSKIILSIMAGITLNSLKKLIKINAIYLRAMPNLASALGEGVTGVFSSDHITPRYKKK